MNRDTFKPLWVFLSKNWLNLILILVSIICMCWAGSLLTREKQSPDVTGLASLFLAVATSFLSVVTTRMYAKFGFDETLRDHGVQIAKGIRVLQDEMETLQDWVFQRREWFKGSPKTIEAIDSSLEHIEQTLRICKNMTATALGGITGVIGDAVAQYESLMKDMSRVRVEASRETAELEEEIEAADTPEAVESLQHRMVQVARESEEKLSQLVQAAGVPAPPEPPTQIFLARCPYCARKNAVEITARKGQTQVVTCQVCENLFNTHVTGANRVIARPMRRINLTGQIFSSEVQKFLEDTRSYIPPVQLEAILKTIVQYHVISPERTPYAVQQAIMQDDTMLTSLGVSHATLRSFFKLAKSGGGFKFAAGTVPTFKAFYTNDLTEESLLRAFLTASVRLISTIYLLTASHLESLTTILLPANCKAGQKVLGELIALHSTPSPEAVDRQNMA